MRRGILASGLVLVLFVLFAAVAFWNIQWSVVNTEEVFTSVVSERGADQAPKSMQRTLNRNVCTFQADIEFMVSSLKGDICDREKELERLSSVVEKEIAPISILFKKDSISLTRKSMRSLDHLVTVLNKNPQLKLQVRGHADITGEASHNDILSQDRAEVVRAYLIHQGSSPEAVWAAGYGPDCPASSNQSRWGRELNRRVEFKAMLAEAF